MKNIIIFMLTAVSAQAFSSIGFAQGCVAAKVNTPILGKQDFYEGPERWQFSLNWRWQRSHRHFIGDKEQKHRKEEGSEVINRLHILDFGLTYDIDQYWSWSLGVPIQMADRSSPVRDAGGDVIDRSMTHARGLGDMTFFVHRWLKDPQENRDGNTKLGLGLKLPTGQNNITDTRKAFDAGTGQIVNQVRTVDQSLQPGDGGFGILLDLQTYWRIMESAYSIYFSALYMITPEGKSGVITYRSDPKESEMAIADQYVARLGVNYAPEGKRYSFSLGGRIEGVPAEDLMGSSRDFRRPGYAVSVEPGVAYTTGRHTMSLAVPVAVYRNRVRNLADKEDGGHGDAAFSDYFVLAGYWVRF